MGEANLPDGDTLLAPADSSPARRAKKAPPVRRNTGGAEEMGTAGTKTARRRPSWAWLPGFAGNLLLPESAGSAFSLKSSLRFIHPSGESFAAGITFATGC